MFWLKSPSNYSNWKVYHQLDKTLGQKGINFWVLLNTRSLYIKDNIVASFIDAATAAEKGIADVGEDDNPVLVVMEL